MRNGKARLRFAASLAVLPLVFGACSSQGGQGGGGSTAGAASAAGKTVVSLWTHSAGNPKEIEVLNQIITDYNASQDKYEVKKQDFPQEAYNDSVKGAAASGDLPCILDVDAPIMPNWAWNGWMVPSGLTDADVQGFLPSTVGRYKNEIYSVGYWEATTLMFTRKSILKEYGIRTPTVDQPWTATEFAALEQKIKAGGKFANVVDWGPGWTGEWWAYGFSPLMQSFGGDLINRDSYATSAGVLNSAESLAFATWFQDQFKQGYAPKSNATDRTEFKNGKVAIQYSGVWGYAENYDKYKDDLLVVPAPDFGKGVKAGAGSWQYGISKGCSDAQKAGALEYLKFSLDTKYLAKWSDVTSLIPSTEAAGNATTKGYYGSGKPLDIATQIAGKFALVRPVTPAYPVISQVYEKNLQDIMNGKNPKAALDQMVKDIDADIQSAGYNG